MRELEEKVDGDDSGIVETDHLTALWGSRRNSTKQEHAGLAMEDEDSNRALTMRVDAHCDRNGRL